MTEAAPEGATFDSILVGSSPISLIEAIYRHHKGEQVAVIERERVLGGVWSSQEAFGLTNVERFCHIMSLSYAHLNNHRFLRRLHNVSLEMRESGALAEDREIHIVNLKAGVRAPAQVSAEEVIGEMVRIGLISREAMVLDAVTNYRELPVANTDTVRQVRRYAGRAVAFLWTRDLSRAFGEHYPRWSAVVPPFATDRPLRSGHRRSQIPTHTVGDDPAE